MENEIKVGDWIRDKEGHITKIIQTLSLFKDVYLYLGEDGYQYSDNAIVKHSSNLIDLIQCGDYVNGYKVISVLDGFADGTVEIELSNHTRIYRHHIEDIEEVVTKEMMESISYKVKQEEN